MLKYIFKLDIITILFFLLAPISAIFTIGISYIMQFILDTAVSGNISKFKTVLSISIIYIFSSVILDYAYKILKSKKIRDISLNLKNDLIDKILNKDFYSFNTYDNSYFDNIFLNDINILENSYFNIVLISYYEIISFLVSLYLIINIDIYLTLVILFLCFIQMLIPYFLGNKSSKLVAKSSSINEKYISNIKNIFLGFEIIKTFNIENSVKVKHNRQNIKNENIKNQSVNFNILINCLSYLVGNIMYIGTLIISSILVLLGKLQIGGIILSSQLMVYVTSPLMSLSETISEIKSSKEIRQKIENILKEKNKNLQSINLKEFKNNIIFENFKILNDNKYILKNINLKIEKNKKYIIIGKSGSGKSTLLNTLSKITQYTGKIFIDDIDLQEIYNEDLYKNLCIARQSPFLFYDTLYNNIVLEENKENKLYELLEKLKLEKFIDALHSGEFDYENLNNLSGGEKQRVALIRALLKESNILLLDEFTSQLDNITAFEIENYILSLEDKTVIMILHRLNENILKKADKIIFIDNGKIEAIGNYEQIKEKIYI